MYSLNGAESCNSTFNITYTFACVQIRHNPLSGGYCGEVPPLPIPNREVKLTCADGTAMQCGRVGSRLLLSRASDFERFLRLFCFHAVLLSYRPVFSHSSSQLLYLFTLLPFYSFTFLPFYFFTFLLFYLFTFIYFPVKNYGESSLVMFMYKMLMNGGFSL